MHTLSSRIFILVLFLSCSGVIPVRGETGDVWKALQTVERGILDAGSHPGNVYLVGEEVIATASPPIPVQAVKWRVLDDQDNVVQEGKVTEEQIKKSALSIGQPGIGWYRIEFLSGAGDCLAWTTAAVLEKLKAPTPQDSPICVDGALAWFARNNKLKQEHVSRLAALAGVNWIRDRLRWREIQPQADQFAENTTYDSSARLQNQAGLKVLQVFHDTPPWAIQDFIDQGRFARDLRHVYRFCRSMSLRYKGLVQAWEPWNEANALDFGAHTVDEMCSMQKAAYLGLKDGNASVTVCWNAYAGIPTPLHTQGVLENETWPYFDTYNIHTYDWPVTYLQLRQPVFEAASGRPIWVTESDRGIPYETEEPWCDLSRTNEKRKAEFIAQSYATSLFAGCSRHFHFILGHYFERRNKIQFGLLRLDLTPRPAYVALAAVGRLLAGGKCLGKWIMEEHPNTHVYAFNAKPDGVERDVLVAWAEKRVDWPNRGQTSVPWPFPATIPIQNIYDYLGRPLKGQIPEDLNGKAYFIFLPKGYAKYLPLESPPMSDFKPGTTSPVVMQLVMPATSTVAVREIPWAVEHEHQVEPSQKINLDLFAYNFSDRSVHGTIAVDRIPNGWQLEPRQWDIAIEPMERVSLPATFMRPAASDEKKVDCWIKLKGNFGEAGKPTLAFRLVTSPGENYPQ